MTVSGVDGRGGAARAHARGEGSATPCAWTAACLKLSNVFKTVASVSAATGATNYIY